MLYEEKFWESALAKWVGNCLSGPNALLAEEEWRTTQHMNSRNIRFAELCNGRPLSLLFSLIEPESRDRPVLKARALKPDLTRRVHTFYHLLRSLTTFYRTHSLYPVSLPDVLRIVEQPFPEKSGHDMQKLISLLLGALVHSDQQSELLQRLQCINGEEAQIVAELTQIAGNKDLLIKLGPDADNLLEDSEAVRRLVEALIEERDYFAFRLLKMAEEMENDEACSTTTISSADLNENHSVSSNDRTDQIQQLREKNENLERKLILKQTEIKIASEAAQEYESELNELRTEFNSQSKQLKESTDQNAELLSELRQQKDEIDQLAFDCQKLRAVENDRKTLLKEKEKWNGIKEENEKLKKHLETLEKSIPALKAESRASHEFQAKNESLNLELRQLRTSLNNSQLETKEAASRAQKLADENEQLLHELKQTSMSFADRSTLSQADFSADLSLEEQISQAKFVELEQKLHDMQIELARAAQPEELQRVQKELGDLQKRFNDLADEKTSMEGRLRKQDVDLKKANDQLRQAERSRVELKSKLVELSVVKAQLQQQEIIQREKDLVSNKLKNAETNMTLQSDQIAKQTAKCRQLEAEIQKQKMQLNKTVNDVEETSNQLQELRLEHDACGRLRKSLESECAALRHRVESLEEELSRTKLNAHGSDAMRKRLNSIEQSLLEKQNIVGELENDNQALKQQADLAANKVQKLREELLTEKTRLADLLSRLRSICATCRLKSTDNDQRFGDEEQLKDDNILIDTIDSLLLAAFTAARTEADALRVERQIQLEEIAVLRRNIEDLKQTHSQFDATEEIDQDKMKVKMNVLQERLNAALARENELAAEVQATKRTVEDFQRQLQQNMKTNSELSRLRINQRDVEQEAHTLKETLTQATEKLHLTEKERIDTSNKLSRLQNTHQAQQNEIERLTKLNDSLAIDFDRYRFENNDLKRKLDMLNDTNRTNNSRQVDYKAMEDNLRQARDTLKQERDRLANCELSLSRTTRELNETRRDYAALLRQKDTTSDELAQLCDTNSAQKSALTNLNLTVQQLNNALADKDAELANFRKEIETLREYNSDENKLLVQQIQMLMAQNQDLHKRSDNFYVEQKELQEKLLNIRRHKEKLEQRLVEQYKQQVEKKPEKTTLVKRAAKALNLRSPSRKNSNVRLHEKASGSEDSSIYSADEGFLDKRCHLTPACSSSDRGSGSSPDYDQIHFGVHHSKKGSIDSQQSSNYSSIDAAAPFRARNTRIGGSLRCPPSYRPVTGPTWRIPTSIEEDMISLNGSERSIDVTSGIRPNHLRNGSMRNGRPPPPYVSKQQNSRPPPPAYNSPSRICLTPPVKNADFMPLNTSTPKSSDYSSTAIKASTPKSVPKEGEHRFVQLDPIERQAKTQSFYDNHNVNTDPLLIVDERLDGTPKKTSNNNWVGYGCV